MATSRITITLLIGSLIVNAGLFLFSWLTPCDPLIVERRVIETTTDVDTVWVVTETRSPPQIITRIDTVYVPRTELLPISTVEHITDNSGLILRYTNTYQDSLLTAEVESLVHGRQLSESMTYTARYINLVTREHTTITESLGPKPHLAVSLSATVPTKGVGFRLRPGVVLVGTRGRSLSYSYDISRSEHWVGVQLRVGL